jgi:nucleoid DNA-binding protein
MDTRKMVIEVASRARVSRYRARIVVDALISTLTSALERGEPVSIARLGSFQPHFREGRPGRNPKTGEPHPIPASTTVKFRPAEPMRRAVNRRRS